MDTFETITDAKDGVMDFMIAHSQTIPDHMVERFRKTMNSPSPVDEIVGLGKLIYANRDQLTAPAWALGGALIAFATVNQWHGLGVDNLGNAIVANLRKDLGEIKTAPDAPTVEDGFRIDPPNNSPTPAPATQGDA